MLSQSTRYLPALKSQAAHRAWSTYSLFAPTRFSRFHIPSFSASSRSNSGHGPQNDTGKSPQSPHAALYSGTLPAMIPVFLLGSAVYLGLELTQLKLAHERYMEESEKQVMQLEAEIDALQQKRANESENPPAVSTSTDSDPPSTPTSKSRWRW